MSASGSTFAFFIHPEIAFIAPDIDHSIGDRMLDSTVSDRIRIGSFFIFWVPSLITGTNSCGVSNGQS